MAVFTPLHLLGLVALAVVAAGQEADSDGKVSAPLALFFYYGTSPVETTRTRNQLGPPQAT